MDMKEAEALKGSLVLTGFIRGGVYIGELIDIIHSRPFRTVVKIKGIYKYPPLYSHNTTGGLLALPTICAENEMAETSSRIQKYEQPYISYQHSLATTLSAYLMDVDECLQQYINNPKYYTNYISSMDDCRKLKKTLVELQSICSRVD